MPAMAAARRTPTAILMSVRLDINARPEPRRPRGDFRALGGWSGLRQHQLPLWLGTAGRAVAGATAVQTAVCVSLGVRRQSRRFGIRRRQLPVWTAATLLAALARNGRESGSWRYRSPDRDRQRSAASGSKSGR